MNDKPDYRLTAKRMIQSFSILAMGVVLVGVGLEFNIAIVKWLGVGVAVFAALLAPFPGYRDSRKPPVAADVTVTDTVKRLFGRK